VYKIWSIIAVDIRGILRFKQMEGLLEGHGFSFNKKPRSQEYKRRKPASQDLLVRHLSWCAV
jgi:hypothetical protein